MVENSIAFDAINKEEVFDNLTISIVQEGLIANEVQEWLDLFGYNKFKIYIILYLIFIK
jgi:hypothetical protein